MIEESAAARVLKAWSGEGSIWSDWAKPVLFSHLKFVPEEPTLFSRQWTAPNDRATALVVEGDPSEGPEMGLSLARCGFRPVPIYVARPFSLDSLVGPPVVNLRTLMNALRNRSEDLMGIRVPPDAPPAFLLDINREGDGSDRIDGQFDNRSVVMQADFPSGESLRKNGIHRVVVIQFGDSPAPDLLYVLLAWQKKGIEIAFQSPWSEWGPFPQTVSEPCLSRRIWDWIHSWTSYRRNLQGEFGGIFRRHAGDG